MKRLAFVLAVIALAGCAVRQQAMIEAVVQPEPNPPAGAYTVTPDCDSLSVVISGYPADGVAFFNADGNPPYHLDPAGDTHTFPEHITAWGLYVRDAAGNVLVNLDGQPTADC